MKKRTWVFATVTVALLGCRVAAGEPILTGETLQVKSAVLREMRTLRVHLPKVTNAPVTVFYVLDGERLFEPAASFCDYFGGVRNTTPRGCMVVGIDAGDKDRRTLNLTPTASAAGRDGKVAPGAPVVGGGADRFLEFVTKEAVPAAESRLAPGTEVAQRILVGHSFGGLFTLNAMAKADGTFRGFVAVDPSLWWDQNRFYRAFPQRIAEAGDTLQGAALYLGFGAAPRKANQVHMDNARAIDHYWLPMLEKVGVDVTQRFFEGENHGTVAIPGIYDAMKRMMLPKK